MVHDAFKALSKGSDLCQLQCPSLSHAAGPDLRHNVRYHTRELVIVCAKAV